MKVLLKEQPSVAFCLPLSGTETRIHLRSRGILGVGEVVKSPRATAGEWTALFLLLSALTLLQGLSHQCGSPELKEDKPGRVPSGP